MENTDEIPTGPSTCCVDGFKGGGGSVVGWSAVIVAVAGTTTTVFCIDVKAARPPEVHSFIMCVVCLRAQLGNVACGASLDTHTETCLNR